AGAVPGIPAGVTRTMGPSPRSREEGPARRRPPIRAGRRCAPLRRRRTRAPPAVLSGVDRIWNLNRVVARFASERAESARILISPSFLIFGRTTPVRAMRLRLAGILYRGPADSRGNVAAVERQASALAR